MARQMNCMTRPSSSCGWGPYRSSLISLVKMTRKTLPRRVATIGASLNAGNRPATIRRIRMTWYVTRHLRYTVTLTKMDWAPIDVCTRRKKCTSILAQSARAFLRSGLKRTTPAGPRVSMEHCLTTNVGRNVRITLQSILAWKARMESIGSLALGGTSTLLSPTWRMTTRKTNCRRKHRRNTRESNNQPQIKTKHHEEKNKKDRIYFDSYVTRPVNDAGIVGHLCIDIELGGERCKSNA